MTIRTRDLGTFGSLSTSFVLAYAFGADLSVVVGHKLDDTEQIGLFRAWLIAAGPPAPPRRDDVRKSLHAPIICER